MSRQTFIFIGTTAQDADLMRLVEQTPWTAVHP